MSTTPTTTEPPRCINCTYCNMYDATCSHPLNDWAYIDYLTPACPSFEPEQITTCNS